MRNFPSPYVGLADLGANDVAALWHCNESSSSSNLLDAASFGAYHLTARNSPSVVESLFAGTTTGARECNKQWFDRATDANLRTILSGSGEGFTVEMLVKMTVAPSSGKYNGLFCASAFESTPTAAGNVITSLRVNDAMKLQYRHQDGIAHDITVIDSQPLELNKVYYIAVTVAPSTEDSSKRRIRLYAAPAPPSVFGAFLRVAADAIASSSGGSSSLLSLHGCWRDSTNGVLIGNLVDGTTFDEVRILRYAATEDALRENYARCFRTFDEKIVVSSRAMNTRTRILVENDDKQWVDLANIYGADMISNVAVRFAGDDNTVSGTFAVRRQRGRLSLSPYMQASRVNIDNTLSYTPLLRSRRRCRIEMALMPCTWSPLGFEWRTMLDGFIDTVDPAKDPIDVAVLGLDAPLIDTMIEAEKEYAGGVTLESHLQTLINDNLATLLPTPILHIHDASSFAIGPYRQEQTSVSEALSALSEQIGMTCRFEWDDGRGAFRLTLRNPPRSKTWDGSNQDFDILANDVIEWQQMVEDPASIVNKVTVKFADVTNSININAIDNSGVGGAIEITTSAAHGRNVGQKIRVAGTSQYNGIYTVAAVLSSTALRIIEVKAGSVPAETTGQLRGDDIQGNGLLQTVVVEDAVSQLIYGKRVGEIILGSNDAVNTWIEAKRLADTVLSDLADPQCNVAVRVPFWPFVELHDLAVLRPDGIHLDTAMAFAVVGWEHQFDDGKASTVISLRGKSAAGRGRRWLGIMTQGGVSAGIPTTYESAVDGAIVGHGVPRGVVVNWNMRRQERTNHFDVAEVHTSQNSGFGPDETTLRGYLRGTQLSVPDLQPENAHHIRVVPVDRFGNRGIPSSEISITPRYTAGIVPAFFAYRSSTAQNISTTALSKVQMNTTLFDKTSDYNTSLFRYTAKTSGLGYLMRFSAGVKITTSGKVKQSGRLFLRHFNSSDVEQNRMTGPLSRAGIDASGVGDEQLSPTVSGIFELQAGDYVELWWQGESSVDAIQPATTSGSANIFVSYFEGSFVGER